MRRQADVRANAHELHGRLICAIARYARLPACTAARPTQLHDLRGLHSPHDYAIRTTARCMRLQDPTTV